MSPAIRADVQIENVSILAESGKAEMTNSKFKTYRRALELIKERNKIRQAILYERYYDAPGSDETEDERHERIMNDDTAWRKF